jgi:hypothetical protein
MKYLRKFNEELKPQTYRRASYKLKKLGHEDRAKDLVEWSNKVEKEQELEKWKQNIEQFSKFGKFKMNIFNPKTNQSLTENFYLSLNIDRDSFGDSLDDIIEDKEGNFWIAIGIIPVDEKTLNKCYEVLPDPDTGNGFFWAMSTTLDFIIDNESIKITKYEINDYDESLSGNVSFADRASAGKFKNLLKKMFSDPNFNYPSGYNDFDYFYEMFYYVFGAQYGLESDFGLIPETISDFIDTLSPNEMYKSL